MTSTTTQIRYVRNGVETSTYITTFGSGLSMTVSFSEGAQGGDIQFVARAGSAGIESDRFTFASAPSDRALLRAAAVLLVQLRQRVAEAGEAPTKVALTQLLARGSNSLTFAVSLAAGLLLVPQPVTDASIRRGIRAGRKSAESGLDAA